MKIPFSIKFRPQIESGEYKVETKVGCPVRIVCWDMICELPILGLVLLNDEKAEEIAVGFTNEGTNLLGEPLYDKLFIVTPEEELTEFEKAIKDMIKPYAAWPDDIFKEESAKLLFLAREQFIKDGYIIEKKVFYDAVEKVSPEVMKEVSVKKDEIFERRRQTLPTSGEVEGIVKSATDYMRGFSDGASTYIPKDMKEALRAEYEKGKADALKDLPRWRLSTYCFDTSCLCNGILFYKSHAIPLKALEELPGFKED